MCVDGVPLHSANHRDALAVLNQCGQEALLQIEYDVSIMGKRNRPKYNVFYSSHSISIRVHTLLEK